MLERVPPQNRSALFFETFYNIGSGTFVALFLLSAAILKTVVDGEPEHLMLLGAMFGGSSLLSPFVSYLGQRVPMRLLVIIPNLTTAALLLVISLPVLVTLPVNRATFLTAIVGCCFILRVFPRVAEMNMYRVLYPVSRRGFAVGWLKAIAAISGLFAVVAGTLWCREFGEHYWVIYAYAACTLVFGAICYSRIPMPQTDVFENNGSGASWAAAMGRWRVFLADKRFVRYQIGFAIAGFANHMGMVYVAEVIKKYAAGSDSQVFLVSAVLPALLIMASSPFWGRFLDRVDPMAGRALFNFLQTIGYSLYCYGGVSGQVWPMVAGAVCHSISNGGGTINWSTGSLYFAKPENVSLYNSLHVGFTGLRGVIAPICGYILMVRYNMGPWMFSLCAGLSLIGSVYMYRLSQTDPGSVEQANADGH